MTLVNIDGSILSPRTKRVEWSRKDQVENERFIKGEVGWIDLKYERYMEYAKRQEAAGLPTNEWEG